MVSRLNITDREGLWEREKKEAAIEMKENMWERKMGIESESIDMREREGYRNDI